MRYLKNKVNTFLGRECDYVRKNTCDGRFFSQEGEDIIASRILGPDRQGGVYVDVGCNHPVRMSNTYWFYLKNWSGVVIDPNPEFKNEFKKLRPRDVYVNKGVSDSAKDLVYFRFAESLFNTFDESRVSEISQKSSKLIGKESISTATLESILRSHWPAGKKIDFLSIDCEGLDLAVLKSHNFVLFPVELICIEVAAANIQEACSSEIVRELGKHGYVFFSRLRNSCIFKKQQEA